MIPDLYKRKRIPVDPVIRSKKIVKLLRKKKGKRIGLVLGGVRARGLALIDRGSRVNGEKFVRFLSESMRDELCCELRNAGCL